MGRGRPGRSFRLFFDVRGYALGARCLFCLFFKQSISLSFGNSVRRGNEYNRGTKVRCFRGVLCFHGFRIFRVILTGCFLSYLVNYLAFNTAHSRCFSFRIFIFCGCVVARWCGPVVTGVLPAVQFDRFYAIYVLPWGLPVYYALGTGVRTAVGANGTMTVTGKQTTSDLRRSLPASRSVYQGEGLH